MTFNPADTDYAEVAALEADMALEELEEVDDEYPYPDEDPCPCWCEMCGCHGICDEQGYPLDEGDEE